MTHHRVLHVLRMQTVAARWLTVAETQPPIWPPVDFGCAVRPDYRLIVLLRRCDLNAFTTHPKGEAYMTMTYGMEEAVENAQALWTSTAKLFVPPLGGRR